MSAIDWDELSKLEGLQKDEFRKKLFGCILIAEGKVFEMSGWGEICWFRETTSAKEGRIGTDEEDEGKEEDEDEDEVFDELDVLDEVYVDEKLVTVIDRMCMEMKHSMNMELYDDI